MTLAIYSSSHFRVFTVFGLSFENDVRLKFSLKFQGWFVTVQLSMFIVFVPSAWAVELFKDITFRFVCQLLFCFSLKVFFLNVFWYSSFFVLHRNRLPGCSVGIPSACCPGFMWFVLRDLNSLSLCPTFVNKFFYFFSVQPQTYPRATNMLACFCDWICLWAERPIMSKDSHVVTASAVSATLRMARAELLHYS